MESILVSSFGRKNIQNAEWYVESVESLNKLTNACVGDIAYVITSGMPVYIKTAKDNNSKDWTLVGYKYNK